MLVAVFLVWTILQLINITLAGPGRLSANLISRQPPLLNPTCAQSCVQAFIRQSFPACSNQGDLNCLCLQSSQSGLTLGEGALQCVVSNCPDVSSSQYQQAYSICHDISGAIRPTHSVISASMNSPSTIILLAPSPTTSRFSSLVLLEPSSTSFTFSWLLPSGTTTGASLTSVQTTLQTSASVPSPSFSSSSSSSQTGSASAANASSTSLYLTPVQSSSSLNTTQIIVISVVCGLVTLAAMAFLAYFCCFRRRQNRESTQSWGTSQPLISPAKNADGYSPNPEMRRANPFIPSKARSLLGQNPSAWNYAGSPPREDYSKNHMGLAADSRYHDAYLSPGSGSSYHPISPPTKSATRAPARPPRDGTEGEIFSRAGTRKTKQSPIKASPDSFNSGPIVRKQPSDPFMKSPEAIYSPPSRTETRRASRHNLPRLDTNTNHFPPRQQSVQPPAALYDATDSARSAETQVYNRVRSVPSSVLPGTAVTTDQAIKPQGPVGLRRPKSGFPPRKSPVFDKFKPIPPPKRRPAAASTVTSFEDDEEPEQRKSIPAVPTIPVSTFLAEQDPVQQPRPTLTHPKSRIQQIKQLPAPPVHPGSSESPVSQIRYPVVPSLSGTPISRTSPSPGVSAVSPNPPVRPLPKRQDSLPFDVSPVTPLLRRKEAFTLPQSRLGITSEPEPSGPLLQDSFPPEDVAELSAEKVTPREPNFSAHAKGYANDTPVPRLSNSLDVSRLFNRGYAELAERGSSKRWSSKDSMIPIHLGRDVTSSLPDSAKNSSFVTPPKRTSRTMQYIPHPLISELPSPDAELLIERHTDPLAEAGQALSPKSESRGARLGAAIAKQNPKARPRGASPPRPKPNANPTDKSCGIASPHQVWSPNQPQQPQTQQQYLPETFFHDQEQDLHPALRSRPNFDLYDEAAITSAYPVEHVQHALSRPGINREHTAASNISANDDIRGTAKWTVLCAPGQVQSQSQSHSRTQGQMWR